MDRVRGREPGPHDKPSEVKYLYFTNYKIFIIRIHWETGNLRHRRWSRTIVPKPSLYLQGRRLRTPSHSVRDTNLHIPDERFDTLKTFSELQGTQSLRSRRYYLTHWSLKRIVPQEDRNRTKTIKSRTLSGLPSVYRVCPEGPRSSE